MEKCAIFIDGGYIDAILQGWKNFPLDYYKLSEKIKGIIGADILRVYYYNCLPIIREMFNVKCSDCNRDFKIHFKPDERKKVFCENCLKIKRSDKQVIIYPNELTEKDKKFREDKERFYNGLKILPKFEVKYGELQLINGEFKQKGVDVLMSLDIVDKCFDKQIQHAILLAGDADFIPAIHKAKECGTIVHLFCNKNKVNKNLLFEVDEVHNFDLSFVNSLKMDKDKSSV